MKKILFIFVAAIAVLSSCSKIDVDQKSDYDTSITKGVAEATIKGQNVLVKWVQLWGNGPKFAEYNVGASSATDVGSKMTFTDATKPGSDYVWGANWCTPSKNQMDELLKAASGYSGKVNCEIVREGNVKTGIIIGFKFTGKETGYTGNSVFFPAQVGYSNRGYAAYWSAERYMILDFDNGHWHCDWYMGNKDYTCLVRPVFKN